MCLSTYQYTPFIAEKDIVCYKTVFAPNDEFEMTSLFYGRKYKLNIVYTESAFLKTSEPNDMTLSNMSGLGLRMVRNGFHSYAKRIDAYFMCSKIKNTVILKCIIPKNSLYYSNNKIDDVHPCYCSDSIKIITWKKPNSLFWKKK